MENGRTSRTKSKKEVPNSEAHITIAIEEELKNEMDQLSHVTKMSRDDYNSMVRMPPQGRNHIFKVHHQLRQLNAKAYEPQTVSIGPYYNGKNHLKAMELHKKMCLKRILARNNNVTLNEYGEAILIKEAEARSYYSGLDNISSKRFVEIMLLDGCFIVELIRSSQTNKHPHMDYLFKVKMDLPELAYDLLLMENQIPLFVVQRLFDMSRMAEDKESFTDAAISFFCGSNDNKNLDSSGVEHLLALIYNHCVPSGSKKSTKHTVSDVYQPKLRTMRHAIALEEAGVNFKPRKEKDEAIRVSLFDIEFANGTMKIPTLRVEDKTERILRNLMAYEQYTEGPSYVCDYAVFMDCLINTNKDAELLHRNGIIDNWLGDHKEVAKMFNKLCQHARISHTSYFENIYRNVDEHCHVFWNKQMAILKHDYFNTPWAIISFFAALLLLLITVTGFIKSFF